MKKLFLALCAALILVAPLAYALEIMLDDQNLEGIDGQAGITITTYGATAMATAIRLEGMSWGDDNGAAAPAGTAAAGHLRYAAAAIGGTTASYLGYTVTIPTGATNGLLVDVDATGIVLGLPTMTIAVVTPPRLQISIRPGVVSSDFANPIDATSTYVLGDLAVDNMTVTVTPPLQMKIAPH